MREIGCVNCEKFRCDFMAQTCELIAPVQPILHQVLFSNETLPGAPKHYETHQNMSLGSNWWIRCVRCKKFQCDFMQWTCALILPFQTTLHRVSCNNETIQNAPKDYKTHQFLSLASNGGIGCVHYEKLWCDFAARTSSLIATVQPILHRVPWSNETLPNAPKYYEMLQNMSFFPMGWSSAFFEKNSHATLWHKLVH